MKILVCIILLAFSFSIAANENEIIIMDIIDIAAVQPDAVFTKELSPNSINGIFGIEARNKIQNYKLNLEQAKSKHFSKVLKFNSKYDWLKINPIKKNNNFADYYIFSPNGDVVTRIIAIGLMNRDLCIVTDNKIFDLFRSKYKDYYYQEHEYRSGGKTKTIKFTPKEELKYNNNDYFMSGTLSISCNNNEILIEFVFNKLEEMTLAEEKRKLNSKKEEKYNDSYNKINVENILN